MGIVDKLGGGRNAALVGAGGTVALVALVAMHKKSSAAATVTTSSSTDPSSPYDSGPYDLWNAWQQEYEGLQNEISAQQSGTTTASGPGSPTSPPPPVQVPTPPPPTPAPPGKTPPPKPRAHTYIVQRGDTLSGIASRYHISMSTLKRLNPVYWTNPKYKQGNLIWRGDKVVI